jgi:hypothetical protein
LFPSALKKRYLILRNLLPLLDSFFIAHTVTAKDLEFEEDEEEENSDSYTSEPDLKQFKPQML